MPDQESVSFDIDPRSVLGAIKQMNAAMESYEKGSTSANTNLQKAIERTSDILLNVNDRARPAQGKRPLARCHGPAGEVHREAGSRLRKDERGTHGRRAVVALEQDV